MPRHAYSDLPEHCFWRESIAMPPPGDVDPGVGAKFRVGRSDSVATAGSCFAQHIARHLRADGFSYFVTETPHPLFSAHLHKDFNYGVFTARYGNIYTARQLVQVLQRAYGLFAPEEDVWQGQNGYVLDPYRPQIHPSGFASLAEFKADRRQHFAAVRRAVEQMDVFVFTLGLTEAWVSRRDGAVYPLCPGVAGGEFDRERYAFCNFNVGEVVDDLAWALDFISAKNAKAKVILTVSPVPLAATAENRSVLVSTTYSKSVLRVAAEQVSQGCRDVAYFPAYEVITGAYARGAYFAADLRNVTQAGVSHVMRVFMKHYAADAPPVLPAATDAESERTRDALAKMQLASRVVCEEEMLGRQTDAEEADMDIMGMMKKAQAMQSKLAETQEELSRIDVEGQSGGGLVKVTLTGKGDMKAIKLDPSLMNPEDVEMAEDLIVAAFADAKGKVERVATEKMQELTAGLPLPPGMKLPF
jgi:DNA-binding YbaB/EbfC family protein